MWAVILCSVIFLSLFSGAEPADVPKSFGCRNSLISDEWRAMVLTFHNEKRRTVARGDQKNKAGEADLPAAKKMNELTWDCNMERVATDEAAKCVDYANNQLGVNQNTFAASSTCNITEKTQEVLNQWWDELTTNGLGADQKYLDASKLDNFANMVYEETNAFACSFAKCSSDIRLLCIYNKLGKENDKVLYEAAAGADTACDDCAAGSECVARLCQPPFTLAAEDPQVCATDSMTNDMSNMAVYMHNYYRALLGSGWAEDKISTYAPLAKAMPALSYDCADLGTEAAARAAACKETPDAPTATRSQNHLAIQNVNIDPEDALKEAISTWWKELADAGLGQDTEYTDAKKTTLGHFANMAFDQTTKVGCSVAKCQKQGFTLAVCQYDKEISVGTKIYEAAKSDAKACSGCTGSKCGDLQGLCA